MTVNDAYRSSLKDLVAPWRARLRRRPYLAEFIVTMILLVLALRFCSAMMIYIEGRPGVSLPDPILQRIGPYRLTWFTFGILWPSIFIGMIALLPRPRYLIMGFQAASLIMLFRTLTLFLVPLEPMPTIMPLHDPMVISLGTGKLIIKDLFFSGHTSIMFLLFLTARYRWLKIFFLLATIVVALFVLLQHVHYSIDVFVAPFITYASWRIVVVAHERFEPEPAGPSH